MKNNLYLELLDGEYLKIASAENVAGQEGVYNSAERYLKIMALFGYQATLSDVQAIDSGLWLDLWGRPGFSDFLRNHEQFVSLRSRSMDGDDRSSFARTIAGLSRTQCPVWTSSAFIDVDRVKRFSELILKRGPSIQDANPDKDRGIPDELLALITSAQHATDRSRLMALLHSLLFFLNRPTLVIEPLGTQHNYYSVLSEISAGAPNSPGAIPLSDEESEFIAKLLGHINESFNDKDKTIRSALRATLDTTNWPAKDRRVWYTVVHAWNCAIRQSLGVEGMVLGSLNGGVHVGLSLDPLEKLLYPANEDGSSKWGKSRTVFPRGDMDIVTIPRDPQDFNWAELDRIVDATTPSQKDLIQSRDGDASFQREVLKKHVKALAGQIAGAPPVSTVPGKILTISTAAIVLLGWQLPKEVTDPRALLAAGLLLPNLIHSLKGRWIASSLKKAHKDLRKTVGENASGM